MAYHDKKFPVLLTFKVTEGHKEHLHQKAKKLGISASEFIRRMIMLD